jgi:hypothetical protein
MKAHDGMDAQPGSAAATVGRGMLPGFRRPITLLAGRTAPSVDQEAFPWRRTA